MSVLQLFTNNAISLLNVSVGPADLVIQVLPGSGSQFPQPANAGEFFLVTLEETAAPFAGEIIKVIGRSGDQLIVDPAGRGQEGTTPRAWAASDTLVDHRLTAETIRQAFLNPPASVTSELDVKLNGTTVESNVTSINFVGDVNVTNPSTGNVNVIVSGSSGGSGSINGESPLAPVEVNAGWQLPVNSVAYSQFNRGFKFLLTIVMPTNGLCQTFEILANISGLIGVNEAVQWTKTNRIGYPFNGNVVVDIDPLTTTLSVLWQNNEAQDVQVQVTRIQHAP